MTGLLAPPPPAPFSPMGAGALGLLVPFVFLVAITFIGIICVRREKRTVVRKRFVEAIARGDLDDAEKQLDLIFPRAPRSKG